MLGAIIFLTLGVFLGIALAAIGSVRLLREKGYSSYKQIPNKNN